MKAISGSGEYIISATPNTPIERQILEVVARNAVLKADDIIYNSTYDDKRLSGQYLNIISLYLPSHY